MRNYILVLLISLFSNFLFSQSQLPEIFKQDHCGALMQIQDYTDEETNICIVLPTPFGSIIHLWCGSQYYEITNFSQNTEIKEQVFGWKLELSIRNKYVKFTNPKGEFYSIDKS